MKHEHMIAFRMAQIWAIAKLAFAFIIAAFYRRKNIWIIAERGDDARDNGYWFFLYMRKHHPQQEIFYVISKNSPDRIKLSEYEPLLLNYRSLKHYIMLWRANCLISTHLQGYFPFKGLGVWVKKIFPFYNNKLHVNIKHGITLNYSPVYEYMYAKWDLIIAGAEPEYQFFRTKFGYPDNHVALTGHARFDNLNNIVPNRQILLMPTWREWIYADKGFEQTEYAQKYAHLLQSPELNNLLDEYNIELVFYPHHEIQRYIDFFNNLNIGKHVIIADKAHYDVQQLLKSSALLLTDYSSVMFDFAYMRKPVVCYHFDYNRYRKEHYQEGWFDYQNSFADVYSQEDKLIEAVRLYIQNGFELKPQHSLYINNLFPYHDSFNCERIYNAITHLHH